jgi:hypothetical protein
MVTNTYDEEEPAIWFRLIELQFAAASSKSQKLNNALASLPKQVHWDILDTGDVLGSSAKASGNLSLNCLGNPWKCKASSPVFSWENSNSISPMESVRTPIFFFPFHVLDPTTPFHAGGGSCRKPQDSCGDS